MKTAIVYASVHHGNTKKLVEAIAAQAEGVTLVDAAKTKEIDLKDYDVIGFASGIYYSKFHQSVLNFASVNMPEYKNTFFICTYGGKPSYDSILQAVQEKAVHILGTYGCKGYDTFGPFKLIGGVAKGHPTQEEVEKAVDFYQEVMKKVSLKE